MATRESTRSAAGEREHHRTNLWAQVARFIGLFLSPFIGLFAAWLIHVWAAGFRVHWGRLHWDVTTPKGMPVVVACLLTLVTVWIAKQAWEFTDHRKDALRRALVISVSLVGFMFSLGVGVGPSYLWSGLFFISTWTVAVVWSIARLDVARNDKTNEEEKEGFLEKHGLKGWRARKVTPIADDKGEPLATEIEFQHAEGDTADQLQDAVPAFESATGSPTGMSQATGTDRADRSMVRIMHRDPLIERRALPQPSSPGGSVADGAVIGTYAKGMPVVVYLGGESPRMPEGPASPSNYLVMGMTRAGKTVGENEMLTEQATRRDGVILYLNKSKGMQDWRPISPSTEVAVIEEDADTGGKYRLALKRVEAIMAYRQRQLGLHAISAWSAEECFHNPPWRTDPATGKRLQMEPMPLLIVHIGEADSILQSDGGVVKTLASKCLSLGIVIGNSLQRADYQQMPTGLRFNLGTALCFGCSDDVSASFALSDTTIKAGAHPENWKQRKPGYFYMEGLGIDDTLFPVPARTFSGESKNALQAELLARNLEWAPRMARLDSGSVEATNYEKDGVVHNWWREMTVETERLRAEILGRPAIVEDDEPADPAAPAPANRPANPGSDDDEYTAELRRLRAARSAVADDDPIEFGDDEDDEEVRKEMEDERRATTHVEGVELYPVDPITGQRGSIEDAEAPLKSGDAEYVSWGDEKPEPKDRAAAITLLGKILGMFMAREDLRDPADSSGNTVIVTVGMIYDEYGKEYRSRPWFEEVTKKMAAGTLEIPGALTLTPAPDLGATKGKLRLQRLGG